MAEQQRLVLWKSGLARLGRQKRTASEVRHQRWRVAGESNLKEREGGGGGGGGGGGASGWETQNKGSKNLQQKKSHQVEVAVQSGV